MVRTSTAEQHNYVCPLCGGRLATDTAGRGYVVHKALPDHAAILGKGTLADAMVASGDLAPDWREHLRETNRCPFQQGQKDGCVRQPGKPTKMGTSAQGVPTADFGLWLTRYMHGTPRCESYQVVYDHGIATSQSNVAAVKGFLGSSVKNVNRLADVDMLVATASGEPVLLIEIEERHCSPKKFLGDILAVLMCDGFAVRLAGRSAILSRDRPDKAALGWDDAGERGPAPQDRSSDRAASPYVLRPIGGNRHAERRNDLQERNCCRDRCAQGRSPRNVSVTHGVAWRNLVDRTRESARFDALPELTPICLRSNRP